MKKIFFVLFVSLLTATAAFSQDKTEAKPTITIAEAKPKPAPAPMKTPAKRGPVFRPTKEQIKQVQAMLKEKSLYKGDATGSYNEETRAGIRSYQKDSGLKVTGTLNRATLEKMGVELTESQKAIPVSEGSYAGESEKASKSEKASGPAATEPKKKPAIFRATKDQIMEAQKTLKAGAMYSGEQTGKLDDPTRAGLKKYQEANGLKVTGTLNRVTLEKMGIELTDTQRAISEGQ